MFSYKDPDIKSVFEEECNKGIHIVSNIVTPVLLMEYVTELVIYMSNFNLSSMVFIMYTPKNYPTFLIIIIISTGP